ncbi:MAG: hypothetical protein JKY66_06850 [Spongiibacteraceae bacterium]|nr:hypothetical protein [Spongiibacteraceae bacterium]
MSGKIYVNDPASKIYTLDPVTASYQEIGAIGISQVTDIAFQGPALYGITFSSFLKINPRTGAGSIVGSIGSGLSANALAVASDGTVYLMAYSGGGSKLATLDTTTGAATIIGDLGAGITPSGDLSFDQNDNLYATVNSGGKVHLSQINTTTGAASLIGDIGSSAVYGLTFFGSQLLAGTAGGKLIQVSAGSGAGTVLAENNLTIWGMDSTDCCY